MGDQTQNLTIKIKEEGGQATAGSVQNLEQRLSSLEQAYVRTSGAGRAHNEVNKEGAQHLTKHAESANNLGEGIKRLGDHSLTAARGFQVMGLEAEAGAAKLTGLGEVLSGVIAAAPELLAIGVALATVSASFLFLKESVDEAAASQRELVTIGALLKNQSVTDWQEQAKAVDEYASAIARASVFQKTDALAGMQAMLTAGVKYNDVLRSQNAAMDLATSLGVSLAQADQSLAMAYDGKFRSLVRLGIVTKEEQKNGIAYETILQRIETRMGGTAAAALDTFSGKVQNLGNIVGLLKEDFGNALLPVLSEFEDALRQGVTAMQPLADEFKSWTQAHLPQLKEGVQGFGDFLIALAQKAMPIVEQGMQQLMGYLADLGKKFRENKDPIHGFIDGIKSAKEAVDKIIAAIEEFERRGQPLADVFNKINEAASGSGKSIHSYSEETRSATQPTDGLTNAVNGLVKAFFAVPDAVDASLTSIGGFLGKMHGALKPPLPSVFVPAKHAAGDGTGSNVAPVRSTSLEEAYAIAQNKTGVSADIIRAIAEKETRQGTGANYNPLTGTDLDGNQGHGIGQLDPASGASPAELALVAKDPVAAAVKIGQMVGANMHNGLLAALQAYGPHDALGAPDPDYAKSVLAMIPAGGPTNAALAQKQAADADNARHRTALPTHPHAPTTPPSDAWIPGTKTDGKGGFNAPPEIEVKRDRIDPVTKEQKELKATLDEITRSEESYVKAVAMATDADDLAAKQLELKKKISTDASNEIKILNGHIDTAREAQARWTTELKQEDVARKDAVAALNAFNAAHDASKMTPADVKEHKELEKAVRDTGEAYARTSKYIEENASATEAMRQQVHALIPKTTEYAAAIAALNAQLADQQKQFTDEQATYGESLTTQKAYYDQKLAEAKAAGESHYNEVVKWSKLSAQAEQDLWKSDENLRAQEAAKDKQVQDELATYGRSLEAQTAYFQKRFDNLKKSDNDYGAEYQTLYAKLQDLHVQFVEKWQDRESTFFDGLLKGTTSLKDSLKNLWASILDDYVKMIEKMIIESSLFKNLNDQIAKAFGMPTDWGQESAGKGPNADATAASTATKARTLAEKTATDATHLRSTAEDQATDVTNTASTAKQNETNAVTTATTAVEGLGRAASAAASSMGSGGSGGGGGGGLGGLLGFIGGIPNFDGGSFNVPSPDTSTMDPGGWANSPNLTAGALDVNIANVDTAIPAGAALPVNVSKVGGSSAAAQAMGAIAVIQGMQSVGQGNGGFGTAVSMGMGAFAATGNPVIAGLAAAYGMFGGPHWGPPSNYPDRSDPTYAGWLSSFNSGPGGVGDHVEQMVKGTNPSTLTGQALADYQKLLGLEGGTGQLGIKDEHNGMFTLFSGLQVSVTDFRATVDRFLNETGGANAAVPAYIIKRSYPDYNASSVDGGASGGGTAGSGAGSGDGGDGTGTGTGGGKGGGGKRVVGNGGDNYYLDITVQGTVKSEQDLVQAVATGLNRLKNGSAPGGGYSGVLTAGGDF